MTALERFQQYLNTIRRRLAWRTLAYGAAAATLCALSATLVLVAWSNRYAFSDASMYAARVMLFLTVGAVVAFGLVAPLLRVNRGQAAKTAERGAPEFEQRLLTLAQRAGDRNPFLELLARDAVRVADSAPPERLVRTRGLAGSLAAAVIFAGGLAWLILSGPGWMGHGAALLWAGPAKESPAFYRIEVTPGSRKVRRGSDQLIEARLFGFDPPGVRLKARYQGSSKWDAVPMQPALSGRGWEFLIAGLPETMEYYVEAGAVRSASHRLTAVDLPAVKRIRVTYHYPSWSGLKAEVEDPGGDLRAVAGTEADLQIETDRPLTDGFLLLDDGSRVAAAAAGERQMRARVRIAKDGSYHVAALDGGDPVRISDDYFIEVREEKAPVVRFLRPGRDAKVSPIEEVSVELEASDDFGLTAFELRYSVNGGAEKSAPLLSRPGATQSRGTHLIDLEPFKLEPGDVVSLYGMAKDARATTQSDIYFLQAQPYEYEFQQAQSGGAQGGGMAQQGANISERQKQIIAATWNQVRGQRKGAQAAEDAAFLAKEQDTLRAQAESLAKRMRSRELAQTNQEFQKFATEMEAASKAMTEAAGQLKGQKWRDALPPEQRALQSLLRAESLFRQIQVAFGRQGGGGGGGAGGGRDLESLFDLELDTEKNTYETGRDGGGQSGEGEVDEALKKLQELARRQQALAEQQRQQQQKTIQQRWAQEMLRREAEELKQRMEELSGRRQNQRGQPGQQAQQGSQPASSSQSKQGQQGQQSQQARRRSLSGMAGGGRSDPRLDRALEQLERATEEMRRASRDQAQPNLPGQNQDRGDARRAADRLGEARDQLAGMRREQSGNRMDDVSRRTEELAEKQREFAQRMQQAFGGGAQAGGPRDSQGRPQPAPGQDPQQNARFADEKQQLQRDLEKLENDMRNAVREMAATQRGASSKLREALAELQQRELRNKMQFNADYLRRGYGPYLQGREQAITEGLDKVRDQVRSAQQALGTSPQGRDNQERALGQLEQLRQQMDRLTSAQGGRRGNPQAQDAPEGQPGGQQGRAQREGAAGSFGRENNPNGGLWRGGFSAMNRGDRRIEAPNRAPLTAEEAAALTRAYQDAQNQLLRLRQEAGEDPELAREMNALVREMQMLDPKKFPGNPALLERMRSEILPGMARLEVLMRRQGEGPGSGVAGGSGDKPPAGYADKVAEYFRKLSRGR